MDKGNTGFADSINVINESLARLEERQKNAHFIANSSRRNVICYGIFLLAIFLPVIIPSIGVVNSYPYEGYNCTSTLEPSANTLNLPIQTYIRTSSSIMAVSLIGYWIYVLVVVFNSSVKNKVYQIGASILMIIIVLLWLVIFFFSICGIVSLELVRQTCIDEHGADNFMTLFQLAVANIVYGMLVNAFIIGGILIAVIAIGH